MPIIKAKSSGFTIVELLIVIVVIAILAAITIVAYNGIQARAKTSAGSMVAGSTAKKAEAWNSIIYSYPSYCMLSTNTLAPTYVAPNCTGAGGTGPTEAKIDNATTVLNQTNPMTATASDGGNDVAYIACANNKGGTVLYWDFARNIQVGVRVGTSTVYGDLGTTAITAACA